MSEWNFRLAGPADAESFVVWTQQNGQVDREDIKAATRAQNPTCLYYAVEKDGFIVAFAPVFMSATLAHLSFNPEADWRDKLKALNILVDEVSRVMKSLGVHEITTLSKEDYPIAQWALKHGFTLDARQLLRLDLNESPKV